MATPTDKFANLYDGLDEYGNLVQDSVQDSAVSTNNEQPEPVDAPGLYDDIDEYGNLITPETPEIPEEEESEGEALDKAKVLVTGLYDLGSMWGGLGEYLQRQLPGGSDLLAEVYGTVRRAATAGGERWIKKMTPAGQRDIAKKYATTGEDAAWRDVDSVMFTILRSAPATLATLGPSAAAARGAFSQAIKEGAGKVAANKAAAKAAGTAGAVTEGGLGAGGIAADITAQLEEMSSEDLQKMEGFKKLQKDNPNMTEDDLRKLLIASATRHTALVGGVVTAAIGKAGGRLEAPAFTGGGGRVKAGLAGGAAETVQEVPQSVAETMATNVGMERPIMEGTLEAGLAGGVGGLGAGTGMGLALGGGSAAAKDDPADGPTAEMDAREKETEQLGKEVDQVRVESAQQIDDIKEAARADTAARGGDALEQEIAAAMAGRDAGAQLDGEVERLNRLWNQRQAADEEARYFDDQVKEDAAREKIQSEAAKRYEEGQKQIAADKQAAEDKAKLAEKVASTVAKDKEAAVAEKAKQSATEKEAVRKTRAAEKADQQLNKLRKRRQELGLEPKRDLEGTSPYPSAREVDAFKGKKPKNTAMAEALAGATQEAAQVAKAKAITGKGRILFRKGEEGASKRLVEEIKTKQGFTVNNQTGQPVTEGFSVGQGMEEVIEGEVTDAQLDAFREKHAEALADPANVLGAWYNKADGKTYLDVSTVFANREEAIAAGITNKELAIYDLKKGEEIRLDGVEEIEAAPAPETAPESFKPQTMKVADLESVKGDAQRKSPAEMAEFTKKIQSGEITPNIIVKVKDGKPVRIVEGNHTLRVLRALGKTDVEVKVQEVAADEGRNFKEFFSNITKGLAGKSSTGKEYAPVIGGVAQNLSNPDSNQGKFATAYSKYRGNFDDHIAFSIPGFKEVQVAVGAALSRTQTAASDILDIGASEGSFAKAVAERSQASVIALDPNPEMQATFDATPVDGAEYSLTALGTREQEGTLAWTEDDGTEIPYFDPKGQKFDVIHEAMVFQFISPDRQAQISRIKELLKADGIAIFEEKMFTDAQEANEAKKNSYKRQYFEQAEMTKKAAEVLEGMDENTVHQNTLESVLTGTFSNVVQFWDSGNFKGYAVSDSPIKLNKFVSAIGDTSSEFSTVETPRKVQSAEKVREQIQLRRVDNQSGKVDNEQAKVVIDEINAKLPGMGVKLLKNFNFLPDALFDQVTEEFGAFAMNAKGLHDSKTGDVYVFSDNHSTLDDVVATAMHEGVAHKGLRVLFSKEKMDAVMDSVYAKGDQAAIKRIAGGYNLDIKNDVDRRLATEEYIAGVAEGNIDTDFFQTLIDAVRQVLHSLGLLQSWTDSDIKALLRRTRSTLKKGRPLSKIKLTSEVEIEETGEVVEIQQTASVALRQMDKRIDVLNRLRTCVS